MRARQPAQLRELGYDEIWLQNWLRFEDKTHVAVLVEESCRAVQVRARGAR